MSLISPIFNRPLRDPHVFNDALNDLKSKGRPEDCSMAANTMFDHRVTRRREQSLIRKWWSRERTEPLSSGERLQNSYVDYFETRVRDRKRPDFLCRHNVHNRVFDGVPNGDLQPDSQLVWLLDISGLDRVFLEAKGKKWKTSRGQQPFRLYPAGYGPDSDEVRRWLDPRLGRSDTAARSFVSTVLELLNTRLLVDGRPYHPKWVGLWDDLAELLKKEPADRWTDRVGKHPPLKPHWFIALVYTADEAKPVLRPTVLDVGWYPCHFPSPPGIEVSRGGLAMDLRSGATDAVREFIHAQIVHRPRHFVASSLLRKCTTARTFNLDGHREAHRRLLQNLFPRLDIAWMADPGSGSVGSGLP